MVRGWVFAVLAFLPMATARAADLDGVSMPDTISVQGVPMQLNGIGLRTYSILGIRIYVAGLYLERRSDNSESILHSRQDKLLEIRFLRNIDAQDARKAWRDGFAQNCKSPCYLDPDGVQRFLAQVPAVRKGEVSKLFFTPKGVEVTMDGHPMGDITDPHFAEVMLSTFIGPVPPTTRLKRELLGSRD